MAQRQVTQAIRRAELYYEETAELGRVFDRHLERTKANLRQAGYLQEQPRSVPR